MYVGTFIIKHMYYRMTLKEQLINYQLLEDHIE